MRKHILKTALITLAVSVGIIIISAPLCALIFPSAASDAAYDLGMYGLSAKCAANAYKRDGKPTTLHTLLERAVFAGDHDLVCEYGDDFIGGEYFQTLTPSDADYFTGNYAVALYVKGKREDALEVVILSASNSFRDHNPTMRLIREAIAKSDKAYASTIYNELKSYETSSYTSEDLQRYNQTVSLLEEFIN